MSTTGRTSGGQGGVPRTVRDIRNRGMGAHGTTTGYGDALLEAAARDALAGRSPGGLADLERIAGAGSFERAPAGLQSLIEDKLLTRSVSPAERAAMSAFGAAPGPETVEDLADLAVPLPGTPPGPLFSPPIVSPAERARMSAFPSPDAPAGGQYVGDPIVALEPGYFEAAPRPDVSTEKADPFEGVSQRTSNFDLRSPLEQRAMDYDWESAMAAEMTPDAEGKWASRVPSGPNEGLILKSVDHPTFDMTIDGEMEAGMEWFKGSDGRWYTFKKGTSDWERAAERMGIGMEKEHPKPGWVPDPTSPTGLREEDARKDLYGPRRSPLGPVGRRPVDELPTPRADLAREYAPTEGRPEGSLEKWRPWRSRITAANRLRSHHPWRDADIVSSLSPKEKATMRKLELRGLTKKDQIHAIRERRFKQMSPPRNRR